MGVAEIAFAARLALAAVFVLAAVAKLADRARSEEAVANFGIPDRLAPTVAFLLPLAELAVAPLLVPASTAGFGAVGASALLGLFTLVVALNLKAGKTPDCHCFGQLGTKRIGPGTLVRNGLLGGLAVVVLVSGPGTSSSTGGRSRSSPSRPTRAPRATSPAGSASTRRVFHSPVRKSLLTVPGNPQVAMLGFPPNSRLLEDGGGCGGNRVRGKAGAGGRFLSCRRSKAG